MRTRERCYQHRQRRYQRHTSGRSWAIDSIESEKSRTKKRVKVKRVLFFLCFYPRTSQRHIIADTKHTFALVELASDASSALDVDERQNNGQKKNRYLCCERESVGLISDYRFSFSLFRYKTVSFLVDFSILCLSFVVVVLHRLFYHVKPTQHHLCGKLCRRNLRCVVRQTLTWLYAHRQRKMLETIVFYFHNFQSTPSKQNGAKRKAENVTVCQWHSSFIRFDSFSNSNISFRSMLFR